MGKIKRELHTNERIGNAIKIFKDIKKQLAIKNKSRH